MPRSGVMQFVGRDDELKRLHAQLQESDRLDITAIAGMGGTENPRVRGLGDRKPSNHVDLYPITFASLRPLGNNRDSFCNKRYSKGPSRLKPLQNQAI